MFSSLMPKNIPPVNSSSISMNRKAASSGCSFHAAAATAMGLPANGALSGCRVLPIQTASQYASSRAGAISTRILARSAGSRRRAKIAARPPCAAHSGRITSRSVHDAV
jgi:hypothetical protein